MKALSALFVLLFLSVSLWAQAGEQNSNFKITVTQFSISNDNAQDVALQSDGKVVIAATVEEGTNKNFALLRYNTDGSLDTAFGINGIAKYSVMNTSKAYCLAIQSDGKIIVAGVANDSSKDYFAMLRYDSNGDLDNTFGTSGVVTTDLTLRSGGANDIILQSDGKIILVGASHSMSASNEDFTIIRYSNSGVKDNSFDGDGIVITDIKNRDNEAYSVAIDGSGNIVVAGYAENNISKYDFAVIRYTSAGALDTSFDTDGIATTAISGNGYNFASSVLIQSDGKILTAGTSILNDNNHGYFTLIRYNNNGSLDSSLDSDGIVRTDLGSGEVYANALSLNTDNKIIVSGFAPGGTSGSDFVTIRYNKSDGSIDTSVGNAGIVQTDIGSSSDAVYGGTIQSDGKILVVGSYVSAKKDIVIARYNTNLTLDHTFDTNGIVTKGVVSGYDSATCSVRQADGKIVVAGYSDNTNNMDIAVARYLKDGGVDNSFAKQGKMRFSSGGHDELIFGIGLQSDGKIILAGYVDDGSKKDVLLTRLLLDGTLDDSFATAGFAKTTVSGYDDEAYDIKIMTDDRIVVSGKSDDATQSKFLLLRYSKDGQLDTTFDSDGIVTTSIGTNAESYALALNGNNIVVAGYTSNGNSKDFALARYTSVGALDSSFGSAGMVTTSIDDHNDTAYDLVIEPDGKIVLVGYSEVGNYLDIALARYTTSGILDTTFNTVGYVKTEIPNRNSIAFSVALSSNQKIIVAGTTDDAVVRYMFLASYNQDGTLDSNFGENGITKVLVEGKDSDAYQLLYDYGKITVIGNRGNNIGSDFFIDQFLGYGVINPSVIMYLLN